MDKMDILNTFHSIADLVELVESLNLSNDEILEIQKTGIGLTNILKIFDGTPLAIVKFLYSATTTVHTIKDQIFINKFNKFLAGTLTNEKDYDMLTQQLSQYGDPNENAFRIVSCVDKVETDKKVKYIINATLCLCHEKITLEQYFRIMHHIENTLDEDLAYMANNIDRQDLPYNTNIQGLYSAGLMYQSIIHEDTLYSFTQIAIDVDKYAVSYDNIEKYPPYALNNDQSIVPKTYIPSAEWIDGMSLGDSTDE